MTDEKTQHENWGGKRVGAGRKKSGWPEDEHKRYTIYCDIYEKMMARAFIELMREAGDGKIQYSKIDYEMITKKFDEMKALKKESKIKKEKI